MNATDNSFFWRRMHSITGVFLVLFLIEHLLTNSEAALFFGEDGYGFVKMVNFIHSLPYLPMIEIFLLGVPILIHLVWGIQYLRTAEPNSQGSDGSKPALGEYGRNKAYTWQRVTSWILVFGIIAHVGQMRFMNYPVKSGSGDTKTFMVPLHLDEGLYTLSDRLDVQLFDTKSIQDKVADHKARWASSGLQNEKKRLDAHKENLTLPSTLSYSPERAMVLERVQDFEREAMWLEALQTKPIEEGMVIAESQDFGTAALLVVRETFKNPVMIALYTLFVLASVYHAFNGLWTFCISWGITLTPRSQTLMQKACVGLMVGIGALGLMSVWGTYWINLRY